MLQQTQVATVIDYYLRWMERWPTVEALASAQEQEVLSLWQGLGYYRRCKLLLSGAIWIAERGMPSTFSAWLSVPGVGRYTAAAIASIAFGEAVAVVDGNVERVFARLTGCRESGQPLHRQAWDWAANVLVAESPGDWNQAMMELGATVCRPKSPNCEVCPLVADCAAFRQGNQDQLPVRARQPETKVVEQWAAVYMRDGKVGLEQIPEGEWWAGMWRFPNRPARGMSLGAIRHVVTRHKVTLNVVRAEDIVEADRLSWYSPRELDELPLPAPQRRAWALACRRDLFSASSAVE